MPRYFFNIRDGLDVPDKVGTHCAGLLEARSQAIRTCGTLIEELGVNFWNEPEDWQMTVTDADGASQFTLRFSPR
jgi:hypothetical protein